MKFKIDLFTDNDNLITIECNTEHIHMVHNKLQELKHIGYIAVNTNADGIGDYILWHKIKAIRIIKVEE